MILVFGVLIGIVVITVLFVVGWLKFLDYLEKQYPSWVGEGLRHRLLNLLFARDIGRGKSNYSKDKIKPTSIVREFKNSSSDVSQRVLQRGISQSSIEQTCPRNNRTTECSKAIDKDTERNLEQEIPVDIHTDKSSTVDNDDSTKRELYPYYRTKELININKRFKPKSTIYDARLKQRFFHQFGTIRTRLNQAD
jgi:hypothetical protein